MIKTTIKHTLHAAFIVCFFSCSHTFASAYDTTASVLRFQTKMAERGVAESQYKLGFMHETGSGIEQSLSTALHWYKKASIQGYQPASNRIVYLQIKSTGIKQQHNHWLSELKRSAQSGDKDALFLLGQMYAEGTGVNKSLTVSLKFLRKAERKNIPDTQPLIIRIERELAALQQSYSLTETTKNIQTPAPITPPVTRKVAAKKSSPSENLKNIKKPLETTKTKSKQKVKLLKKTPLKVKNKPKITHTAKSTSVPIKNKSGNKPASPIVPATTADEPEYSHPMDTICGGSNRLRSGCR